MTRLRCRIGLHDWVYAPALYRTEQDKRLALPAQPATRTCSHCDKVQIEDRHCLGLNPPEYSSTWFNRPAQ